MCFNQQQTEQFTQSLRQQLGDNIYWQYDERLSAMLSEFAQNKSSAILLLIQQSFPHQWDKKSIKNLPKLLKEQLGQLANVKKQQLLFTRPATDTEPTMIACWWPWEHGGTFSLRIKLLDESYQYNDSEDSQRGILAKLKSFLS